MMSKRIKEKLDNIEDVGFYFKKFLDKNINNSAILLDIGCGHATFAKEYYLRAKKRVGIDPDECALKKNEIMDEKICCSISDAKLSNNYFDVVIAQWVLEHLENPQTDIERIAKSCKSGGAFIFMTTNLYSPLMIFSKLLPIKIKKRLRSSCLNVDEDDTYKTYYRINTPKQINRILKNAGFEKLDLQLVEAQTYFSWSAILFFAWGAFEKSVGAILPIKTHIVGVYKKL